MGKFIKGIHGGVSGKVGNVIGSHWKDIDYWRSLARKSNKPATQKQVDVRYIFEMVRKFCKPVSALIKLGFASAKSQTPFNAALAYNISNAVTGLSPNFTIDFDKVVFSTGPLEKPEGTSAFALTPAKVGASWREKAGTLGEYKATDEAILVIYNTAQKNFVMVENAAVRSDLEASVTMPADFVGEDVHVWLVFREVGTNRLSNSVYMGMVTVL